METIKKTEITSDDLILIQKLKKEYEDKKKELIKQIFKEILSELKYT